MFKGMMCINDFAKELGKNEQTVRTWIRRGDLPPFVIKKIGGSLFILSDKFKEWIDKGEGRDIPEGNE